MNNDFKAYKKANHSSMSSNYPFAKKSLQKNINKNANTYNPNNEQISPNQNEIIKGYYINTGGGQNYRRNNSPEEGIEIEENEINEDMYEREEEEDEKDNEEFKNGELEEGFIGESEYVRRQVPNNSPYYGPVLDYSNFNRREYNYENHENNEEIEDDSNYNYLRSPNQNDFTRTNYNKFGNKVYQKRRVLGNLRDSASSEAYANNKSNTRTTLTEYRNSGIYIKPKTAYNNLNNNNYGISTEERGIESLQESTKILNQSTQVYDFPKAEQKKGGKVDLNIGINKLNIKKNRKNVEQDEPKEEYDIPMYEQNIDKIIKIQSVYRGYKIKSIIDEYHDIDEFIFHISKVQFNHFYDNFYFFINQLFNVYKSKTLDEVGDPENNFDDEGSEGESDNENMEDKDMNNSQEEDDDINNKSYEQLKNDYTDLRRRYNALMRRNNANNNINNITNNSKTSFKKMNLNAEVASLPGETTFGSIKTDTNKLKKFKYNLRPKNNSTTNINDNLSISNYYNEEENENNNKDRRKFYTPEHNNNYEDEEYKRYSYSSLHSEENSKFFDNENLKKKHRFKSVNVGKMKGIRLNKPERKNKVFEYSPSIEYDKINLNNNDKINNISIININKSALEDQEQEDLFDKKKIEDMAYDKYIINYSKDLRIVKNNKIILKSKEQKEIKENEENKINENDILMKENENMIQIEALKKTDEQKIKDIYDNKKLLNKMKQKFDKENSLKLKLSKRTKDNYLTIKPLKNKKLNDNINNNLLQIKENDFEIKNEYYYIETADNNIEDLSKNKNENENKNEFNNDKTIFSSENNFNIKAKSDENKKNKFEDIESNELMIINKLRKKNKKENEINNNERFIIDAEIKKWNLSTDLNPIANDEFSINNDDYNNIINDKSTISDKLSYDIESNELQIIDKIKKNIIKENKENINVRDNRDSIQLNEEKDEYKIKERKKILFKSNENNINLKPIKKENLREIKITTKKILKHEKILSGKKFLKLKDSSENSFLIKNSYTSKVPHKKDLISLIPSTNDKFIIKRKKSKKKEEEIQATEKKDFNVEEIDEITLESLNKDYVENIINDNYEKDLKERKKMLQKMKNDEINIKGKELEKNKFMILNIGKNKENDVMYENEGKKKKKMFDNLDIKKCEGCSINGIQKENKNLIKIKNDELMITTEEKLKKENDASYDIKLINEKLEPKNDINYTINSKKKENIIVKNNLINIKAKKDANKNNLIIVKQKKLNLISKNPKIFTKERIEPCYSESITIKTREEYEDPIPKFSLSKKFNKLLSSENENSYPKPNTNLISTLSSSSENQIEIIGIKKENKEIKDISKQSKPIIEEDKDKNEFKKNMTKLFINNMVENKLEIEKKKSLDNTKNKLIKVYKTMKMKNALYNKSLQSKKDFFDKLKKTKLNKKQLYINNTICHNYISNNKKGENKGQQNILYIENNTLQIRHKNKNKKNLFPINENEINIKKNTKKIKKVDEEVQISPLRDIKITVKRTYKKEKILQKNFKNIINTNLDSFTINPGLNMVDIATQTPKLRPKNKVPEKLIFNEIKTVIKNNRMNNTVYNFNAYEVNQISNISYLGNMSNTEINEINNINMKFEKEESNNINNINDPDKLYRISQIQKILKLFFNKNDSFLKLIYLLKWKNNTKNSDKPESIINQDKDIIINESKVKSDLDKETIEKANSLLLNLFERRKKEVYNMMKKKGKKSDSKKLRRKENAAKKLNSVIKQYLGHYVFDLYKKSKKKV